MAKADKQGGAAARAGGAEGIERQLKSLGTLRSTGLRRATDVYEYIVNTLEDHGAQSLSVKEVNTNLQGTRQLLSTVQTVHRLQRDSGVIATNPQLTKFSQLLEGGKAV